MTTPPRKRVLNVGGFSKTIPIPEIYAGWEHHLLDINAAAQPDIVCDARHLTSLPPGQYDAIYCSHNLEHYYRHDVLKVLQGFRHLLKPDGFAHIRVPDMARVMREAVNRKLDIDDVLYETPRGNITVLDVIYGHSEELAKSGNDFFAHKTGFTVKSLVALLTGNGFLHVYGGSAIARDLEITLYAFPAFPEDAYIDLIGLPEQKKAPPALPPTQDGTALATLGIVDIRNRANGFLEKGDIQGAVACYEQWIAASQSPLAYAAYYNIACLHGEVGDIQGAITAYRQSLASNPEFLPSRANLGANLEKVGDVEGAIREWAQILATPDGNPNDAAALLTACNNLGRVYEQKRRFPEAEQVLTRSLGINPDQPHVIHHLVHLRQRQCVWPIYPTLANVPHDTLVHHTSALAMLSASNDPLQQLDTARRYIAEAVPETYRPLASGNAYAHQRLRLGYLSSNFGRHAVSILTAELFELHDRTRFEVFGFSMNGNDNSAMRQRVEQAFDHFIPVEQLSDAAAAQAIREQEIDILIDLQGLTQGVRPGILAHRPAPLQITYLGFPGSTGSPWIDYVIADRYLIPPDAEAFYSEKPLHMPHCFQVNDRQREIGPPPTRTEYGLPEDAFVYCAFNHNYKITPELFDVWMQILKKTTGSLLWLLADNPAAQENLLKEAKRRGIKADRLVFAPRIAPAQYLARFQAADLFLDTFPFNGGTTASDALWAGLPLLTCSGKTFAARMAGSLLSNIGLNELITDNLAAYQEKAIALFKHPATLKKLRQYLQTNRDTAPLFDTPSFVKDLEAHLLALTTAAKG